MNGKILALRRKVPPEVVLVGIVLLGMYLPVFVELVSDWEKDPNYSHGFLVPLVSLFLIWKRRKDLGQIQARISPLGLWVISAGLFLFIVGTAGAEYFSVRLSFVVLLFGLIWYFGSSQMGRVLAFPVWYLVLAIPIPYVIYYALAFPLQLWASKATVFLLHLIGMPSLRQGNIIHLPNYSLEVAEACSGLRSLVSLMALSAVYAYLTQKNKVKKFILFISAIPIALVANIFRILMTAIGAYLISPKVAEDFLHELSGLVVFAVSFICLFIFGAILKGIGTKKTSPA